MRDTQLVSAKELEAAIQLKARTALRMAQAGLIPHYKLGARLGAVRFSLPEVLDALRRLASR